MATVPTFVMWTLCLGPLSHSWATAGQGGAEQQHLLQGDQLPRGGTRSGWGLISSSWKRLEGWGGRA